MRKAAAAVEQEAERVRPAEVAQREARAARRPVRPAVLERAVRQELRARHPPPLRRLLLRL